MRTYWIPILLTTLAVGIWVSIGHSYNHVGVGWGIALLLSTLSGLVLSYDRDRWTLAIGWFGLLSLSMLVRFPLNIILILGSATLGFGLATLAVRDLFQGTNIRPLNYMIRVLLGLLHEPQTIAPPHNIISEPVAKKVGPRKITIEHEAAVLLEGSTPQVRVYGPGQFVSERSEYVYRVYNLKPLHRNYRFTSVLTKDLLAIQINIAITYGIDVAKEARRGERELMPQEINAIHELNHWAEDWETELRSVVEQNIRHVVGQVKMEDASSNYYYGCLFPLIRRYTRQAAARCGVRIYTLRIVSVYPTNHVMQAYEDNWLSCIRGNTLIRQEVARSEAWGKALYRMAEACALASELNIPPQVIYHELLRRLFEQDTLHPESAGLLPAQLANILSDLRKNYSQAP